MAAWMGGEFEGEWIHVWLSPFAVHLKLSQRFDPTILQHKMKNLKKEESEILETVLRVIILKEENVWARTKYGDNFKKLFYSFIHVLCM